MLRKVLVLENSRQIDWGQVEKTLHRQFGVNAVAYDKAGDRRTTGQIDWVNDICRMIKRHPRGVQDICEDIQRFLNGEARAKKRTVTDECAAGMYKIVVPVIRDDDIEGFVSTCGRPFGNTDRIYTHFIHATIDEDEEQIENLLSTLAPLKPQTISRIIETITRYC